MQRLIPIATAAAIVLAALSPACAQTDTRPVITVAVEQIFNKDTPRGVREWTNEEFNKLCGEFEASTDMSKRPALFRRMLEIIEREDPGYTVLHRSASFTGKRRDIAWSHSPTQAMDFRADNFKLVN